jgi:type I restriction enzyme S subunit
MIFYKETNFKETPVGKIPRDWGVVNFASMVNILKGYAFSSEFFNEKKEGLPLIRIRDLGKNETECYYSGEYDPVYIVRKGDILISMDGEFNVYSWNGPEGLLNQRACKVSSKEPEKLDNNFLFYALQKPIKIIESQISQTTVKHLLDKDIERIKIPFPPVEEQKAIAEVLGVVDSVIAKTDEVIAKTERLKKGLMQTLLTRGIGHKEYKQTPIGTVPKNWELVRINELGELQYGYTTSAVQENTGTKFLRITDIQEDGSVNWEEVPYCHIEKDEFSKYALQKGDLLFARIGATAGKTTYINHNVSGIFASYLIRLKTTKENVYPNFLFYFTQSPAYWSQALRQREGQLKKGINATMLSNFIVPLPSFEEQQKIAEILSNIDKKLELERKEKGKLEKVKRGLMDLLLTGKIRVKV